MSDTNTTPAPAPETSAAPAATSTAAPPAAPAVDHVTARLVELKVEPAMIAKIVDLGVESVADLSEIKVEDLTALGMKPIPAKKLVASFKSVPAAATAATPATAAPGAFSMMSFDNMLPAVPTDDSWLTMLKAGGVLKVDQSTVISAVRAALGQRVGLFNILDKVVEKMESFADSNDEPVSPEFFRLRKTMTRRNYAEIFSALEGFEGSYVTDGRKKQLFQRIDTIFWPAINAFYLQLKQWQEAWMQGAANPALMMNAVMAAVSGVGGGMPPGMMSPPETGALRDAADALNDAINKVFAGTGAQIAAAIAYDASKIKETLSNPGLPALMGFANRDQMLRQLGASVPATYPRLETNLTRFVLSVIQLRNIAAGNEETAFLGSLYMLGSQIQWDQIGVEPVRGGRTLSTIGSPSRRSGRDDNDL